MTKSNTFWPMICIITLCANFHLRLLTQNLQQNCTAKVYWNFQRCVESFQLVKVCRRNLSYHGASYYGEGDRNVSWVWSIYFALWQRSMGSSKLMIGNPYCSLIGCVSSNQKSVVLLRLILLDGSVIRFLIGWPTANHLPLVTASANKNKEHGWMDRLRVQTPHLGLSRVSSNITYNREP